MLKAVISSLLTGLYAVYKAESNALASLTNNLYAVYKAESNANDSLGTYNGTAQGGLTYTAGKSGNAFTFNGSNAYVSFTAGAFNTLTTDFSVSAWVYLPVGYSGLDNCPVFMNMSAPSWLNNPGGFWLRFAGPTIQLAIADKTNATFFNYNTTADLLPGTWAHIVATRKSGTISKIYVNNVLKASNTDTYNPVYYTGINLTTPTIGNIKMPNGVQDSNYAFNGSKVDELNIWNKELTSTEITELYKSGNGVFYQNNAFYSTIVNDSLATYNGTAQGGLTYSTGKSGNAFTFNGTNAYVQLPDNALNSLNGSFSVSAWFKTSSSILNVDNYILNNLSANTWFNNGNGFGVEQYGNVLNFTIYNNTNTETVLGANYTFSTNTWYHVTATKLANGNMNLYLNGSLVGTKVTSVNPTYLATVSKPCIGALNIPARGSVGYFAQSGFAVDELNIWNKELSSTEVTELYNAGTGKFYPY
jgi:hypothetical protein